MGGALAEGLLKCDTFMAGDITVADPNRETLEHFAERGTTVTPDNALAALGADVVAVVVKPWLVESVLKGIKDSLDYAKQLLIVVAAGVSSADIKGWLDKDGQTEPHFFLAIPNIAIAEETQTIKGVFDSLGSCLVTEERLLASGTTLASCGIAYAMRYIRASVEGGVELGFKAKDAEQVVLQTVKGAVELLQATGEHPEAAIDKVTTPGGVTIKGLNEMEHAGFTSAVIRGLKAGLQ